MKVLIVDDTTFMRATIRRILENQNIEGIYEAVDGLDALTKYKIIRPELVIMDISMPVMDGIESVKMIKAFDEGANIIICSLQGQKANVMEAIKSGARSFLVKPVKEEKLLAEIAKLSINLKKKSEAQATIPDKILEENEALAVLAAGMEMDSQIDAQLKALQSMSDSDEEFKRSEDYLKGIEEGYLEARREIATNMVRLGIDVEMIIQCVELTEEDLESLKIEYKLGF